MSNTARKARKRLGEKHDKFNPATAVPKVGTPVLERSWFTAEFFGLKGTRYATQLRPRSKKRIDKALEYRTMEAVR